VAPPTAQRYNFRMHESVSRTGQPGLRTPAATVEIEKKLGNVMSPRKLFVALLALFGCARGDAGGYLPDGHVLFQPDNEAFQARAPDEYRVRVSTTEGEFTIHVVREWAPHGADRFYNLVRNGYYDGVYFFRVVGGFVAQFGVHGDPRVNDAWMRERIPDDPVVLSNVRGVVTFAAAGPETRTTQVFINLRDNSHLDADGFAPIGRVVEGMGVVDRLFAGYGETKPEGRGPDPVRYMERGNPYIEQDYPSLDRIETATIVE